MKKITFILAAFAALFTAEANAQLVNDTDGYQRFEASFASGNMHNEVNLMGLTAKDDEKTKGFELGYVKGINITTNMPLFLELGGNFTFLHNKNEDHGITTKLTMANIAIPVDVAYKFAFSSSNFTILPFIGPNFKFNLIGKTRADLSQIAEEDYKSKQNLFDKDDMGDNTAKRFQFGMNIGAGVNIGKILYVGYKLQPDFIRYMKIDSDNYSKTRTQYVTIGINF